MALSSVNHKGGYGRWLLFNKEFPQTHGMRLTCVLQNVYKRVPKSTLDDTLLTDKFTNCRLCRNVKLSTSPFYSSPQVWAYHKYESNFHLKICVLPVISLTLYWTIFRYFTFLIFKQFPLTSSAQISLLLNVFSVTGDCIGLNQLNSVTRASISARGFITSTKRVYSLTGFFDWCHTGCWFHGWFSVFLEVILFICLSSFNEITLSVLMSPKCCWVWKIMRRH